MNNKNNKNEMGRGWQGRIGGLLIFALFAGGFGWVGVGAIKSVTALLHGAWVVRSWQPVPVEVLENELHASTDHEGSTTYAVRARYHYEWAGRRYESTRVGLAGGGSDNIDDWHQVWDARLRAAREGGPPLTAWIDPQHPERAVLDRQLRWRQLLFLSPFAILFPLVALGAACGVWLSLGHSDRPAAPAAQVRLRPRHNLIGSWLLALAIGVMTLPAVGMASTASAPVWAAVLAAVFVLTALTLLWTTLRASRRAWIYRGAYASLQPAQPRAGATFQASWVLPPRPSAAWPAHTAVRLRVAHYRIDESGSSTSERLAEQFVQEARPSLQADGGMTLQARFVLPADAPSQGARRSGEKVDWRLEWLDAREAVVMAVPLPVQAGAASDDPASDRFSREPMPKLDIPAPTSEDLMPSLPAGVRLLERPDALVLSFGRASGLGSASWPRSDGPLPSSDRWWAWKPCCWRWACTPSRGAGRWR